jgi:hypothetical protein
MAESIPTEESVPLFTIPTMTHKVVVYAQAERVDTLSHF